MNAAFNGSGGLKVDSLDQLIDIGKGLGNIAGLERQQSFAGGFAQRLLDALDKIQQRHGLVVADVKQPVGG